jgi:hypothetical protein
MAANDKLGVSGQTRTVISDPQVLNTLKNRYDVTVTVAAGAFVCGADELVVSEIPFNTAVHPKKWVYSGQERVGF